MKFNQCLNVACCVKRFVIILTVKELNYSELNLPLIVASKIHFRLFVNANFFCALYVLYMKHLDCYMLHLNAGLARAKSFPTKTYSHEVVTLW